MKELRRTEQAPEQAPRSWWLDPVSRADFQAAAIREELRMRHSRAYAQISPVVVGQIREPQS